jgi:hypothetical protein
MTDQDPIAEAILDALNAALAAEFTSAVAAYDRDGVPDGPPALFVSISLYRIRVDGRRFGGDVTVPGYFLDTAYRAPSVSNCRALRRVVTETLENQLIGAYGPFMFNDESQPIDTDADYGISGVDTWSFC